MSDFNIDFPPHRGENEVRSVDEVRLLRDVVPNGVTEGTFRAAFRLIKTRPKETLLLGFIQTIFGAGGGTFANPSSLFKPFIKPSPNADYDYADSIIGLVGPVIGASGLSETAIMWIAVLIVLAGFVMLSILHVGIEGGVGLFWLRLVRGQDAQLNHVGRVVPLLIPLILTDFLVMFAIMGGYIAAIIPGIMLMLGFQFVGLVVLDKNLHYADALKASWRITNGHKWDLLIMFVLIMLMNTAGAMVFCVGLFVTTAIATGAIVIVYDRIVQPGNAYLDFGDDVISAFD